MFCQTQDRPQSSQLRQFTPASPAIWQFRKHELLIPVKFQTFDLSLKSVKQVIYLIESEFIPIMGNVRNHIEFRTSILTIVSK